MKKEKNLIMLKSGSKKSGQLRFVLKIKEETG